MSTGNNNEEAIEKQYLEHSKYIVVAILATSIAIMTNLKSSDVITDEIKTAIFIFAITIPYLLWDVFFINIQQPDGKYEHWFFTLLRFLFCMFGCVGIAYTFSGLNNISKNYTTFNLFIYSFISFFVLRFIPIVSFFYIRRRKEKTDKIQN